MNPTKTILLVMLVSFGLNTVAQVVRNANKGASNNSHTIQADATIAGGQKTTNQTINSDTILGNASVHTKDNCIPPKDLTAEAKPWFYINLLWDQPYQPVTEWIFYHDGSFESEFCSTAGGLGLAQVFTPAEYPVTVIEVRYYNGAYGSPGQENEVYVLTGDGSTILAGPYSIIGEPGDIWVTIDVDDITLESGTFMVYTANVLPDGPFVGVDDSFYDGTLYFGSVGEFTELGTYGYYYVGSHEALVTYDELSADPSTNSTVLRPANAGNSSSAIAVSNHISAGVIRPIDNNQTIFLGYNIYESGELIEALWPYNSYVYWGYNYDYYCFTITSVYSNCESDSSNRACEYLVTSINELEENEVSLFPNPASNSIAIKSIHKITRITLTNYIGQIIYVEDVNGDTRVELNTNSYTTGVYLVKIETESGIATKRVVINR